MELQQQQLLQQSQAESVSSPKLSFAADLWDGVDLLKEKTDVGLENCKDVLEFFKKLSALEDEYAKKVSALAQKFLPRQENSTLSIGWKALVVSLDKHADLHKNLSLNVTTNLCHPIHALLKDMDTRRKQLVASAVKLKYDQKEIVEAVKKAKARYEKISKDLEIARAEFQAAKMSEPDPQSAKLQRLEKRVSAAESEAMTIETQYRSQIETTNQFLEEFQTTKWPAILQEFEDFEATRIHFLKANIQNFMGLMQDLPTVLTNEITIAFKYAGQIDADVDIQKFIQTNRTKKDIIPPFVFEQYVETGKIPIARTISFWDQFRGTSTPPAPQQGGKETELSLRGVFSTPLTELVEKEKDRDNNETNIPKIITVLTEGLINANALSVEGIFRIAGSANEIQNLKKQLDRGNYEIATMDAHVLGGVLKLFLREMPVPLIPPQHYDECIANALNPVAILEKLPPVHRDTLTYLIGFLQIFAQPNHVAHSRMDFVNLAILWAPNIFRCPYNDVASMLATSTLERQFTEQILKKLTVDRIRFPQLMKFDERTIQENVRGAESEEAALLPKTL